MPSETKEPETTTQESGVSIMENIEVDFDKRSITPLYPGARLVGVKVLGVKSLHPPADG